MARKVHDARVLANSTFYRKANSGTLLPERKQTINGVDVPLINHGDPAYPLLPWMMKPFAVNGHLTAADHHYNYHQSRARMVVENAFGRLKGRWRCLSEHTTNVVVSCAVLHNICEQLGDVCHPDWIHNIDESNNDSSVIAVTTGTGILYEIH